VGRLSPIIGELARDPCFAARTLDARAITFVCAILLAVVDSAPRAQELGPRDQQEIEQQNERMRREYAERLSRSRLVGSADTLAIEMPDGERISVARKAGCSPPVSRGGVIKVDCTPTDGPAHYFDESTGAMIESCSFWFPDPKRCPPNRWPVEVQGCDGAVPQDITGTWRFHALPSAGGFSSVNGGWTMTLADGSISFDFPAFAQVVRSYTVIDRRDRRYTVEVEDAAAATTTLDIELAACGMLVEANAGCDAFCENMASEVGTPTEEQLRAMLAKSLPESVDEATLARIVESAKSQQRQDPRPLFPERAFFRAVTND
jgi:hypothetical protein